MKKLIEDFELEHYKIQLLIIRILEEITNGRDEIYFIQHSIREREINWIKKTDGFEIEFIEYIKEWKLTWGDIDA